MPSSLAGLGFLTGIGGDMAARIRVHDWARTPLGPPDTWPASLRSALGICLATSAPVGICWGSEFVFFYNDALRDLVGSKHPSALGRPVRNVFPEIWEAIGPMLAHVLSTGEAAGARNKLLQLDRRGFVEDCYFDYAFSPIRSEEGRIEGVLGIAAEITDRIKVENALRISERRQSFLLRFDDRIRNLTGAAAIMAAAAESLGCHLGVGRCGYGEVDESGEFLTVRDDWTDGSMQSLAGRVRLNDFSRHIVGEFRAGRTVRLDDLYADARTEGVEAAYSSIGNVRAGMAVPLVKGGRSVAALYAHQTAPRRWSDEDEALIREVAERTWAAVERVRAETALAESEARLRNALDIDTVGVIFWSRDFEIVEANEAFLGMSGYAREEALGLAWQQLTPEEFHPASERAVADLDATGRTAPYEKQYIRKDGSRWWGLFAPRRTGPHGVVEYVLDVTARRQAEEALRESEERFRSFAEASSDILWIVDAEAMRLEYVSPAFERIWGEPRDRIMSDLGRFAELLHPEDRERAVNFIPRLLAGETCVQEYRIRRPGDGAVRWILDTGFPIRDETGRVRRVAGISQDLTLRKNAEEQVWASQERLRSLVEGIPQLVWRAVGAGRWIWASPQWTRYTGLSGEASCGHGWLDAVHPGDRERVGAAWSKAAARQKFDVEYRVRHAGEGRHRWVQTRATPVRDQSDAIVEWFGTSTDIDDLRRLQDEQQVLMAELQHRTRNLLAVVRSLADKTMDESGGSLETFRGAYRDRLAALSRVQGLLSRGASGARVALDDLLRAELAAHGAMDGDAAEARRLVLDGPKGIVLPSRAVQTLALAIHELATNAVKYGALSLSSGRLRIEWRVEDTHAGGRRLLLEWQESGVTAPADGGTGQGGYGRELIERALPYQLGAETRYEMRPDGVRCSVNMPIKPGNDAREGHHG